MINTGLVPIFQSHEYQSPCHVQIAKNPYAHKKYLAKIWELKSTNAFFDKHDIAAQLGCDAANAKALVENCDRWLQTNSRFSWTPQLLSCLATTLKTLKISVSNEQVLKEPLQLTHIQSKTMSLYYRIYGSHLISPPCYSAIQNKILEMNLSTNSGNFLANNPYTHKKYLAKIWELKSTNAFFDKHDIAAQLGCDAANAKALVETCDRWLQSNSRFSWTPQLLSCLATTLDTLKISVHNAEVLKDPLQLAHIQSKIMYLYYRIDGSHLICPPCYLTIQNKILEMTISAKNGNFLAKKGNFLDTKFLTPTKPVSPECNERTNTLQIDEDLLSILELDKQPAYDSQTIDNDILMAIMCEDLFFANAEKTLPLIATNSVKDQQSFPSNEQAPTNELIPSLSAWQKNTRKNSFPKLSPFDASYTTAMHSLLKTIWTKRAKKSYLEFISEANHLASNDPNKRDILIQNCSQWLHTCQTGPWSTEEINCLQIAIAQHPNASPSYLRDHMMCNYYTINDTPLKPRLIKELTAKIEELKSVDFSPTALKRPFEGTKVVYSKKAKLTPADVG